MPSTIPRKPCVVGFAAMVTVLAMASAAFACTKYAGKVELTATGSGDVAQADGPDFGLHEYCSGEARQTVDMDALNSFNLSVGMTTTCVAAGFSENTMPNYASYEVRWVNASGSILLGNARFNCNADAVNTTVLSTTFAVSGGTGSANFTHPTGGIGYVNLCLTAPQAARTLPGMDVAAPELWLLVV